LIQVVAQAIVEVAHTIPAHLIHVLPQAVHRHVVAVLVEALAVVVVDVKLKKSKYN
jgi:hypothetical protein